MFEGSVPRVDFRATVGLKIYLISGNGCAERSVLPFRGLLPAFEFSFTFFPNRCSALCGALVWEYQLMKTVVKKGVHKLP